jgi:outer membrane protein OmpA-like peptidoglycan-associated protein
MSLAPWARHATLALTLLAVSRPALAQEEDDGTLDGYDADIDIIRPLFTTDILPGIDLPDTRRGGTVRWGLVTTYALNPLVLYEFDTELGPVVANRFSAYLGASVDVTRAFTVRASLPMYMTWGSQVPRYAADGFAIGDLAVGMRWSFLRKPTYGLGVRADITLPTSRHFAYAGERMPRVHASFLAMGDIGRVRLATDLGVNIRFSVLNTTEDFTLGNELVWNNGLRVSILPDKLAAGLSVYSRFGFNNFFGAAESSGEAMITVAYKALPILWVNVGVGRGFTEGYGSSDFRGFIELAFQKVRPPKEDPDAFTGEEGADGAAGDGLKFNVRSIDQIRAGGEGDLTEEPEWAEGELARIEAERIRIREAIRFKVGTAELLPDSFPTLDFIASLMNNDARIGHLVIEGHSSEDGETEPNYKLSLSRAASIWERLLQQGVHPARMSFRGMGEVMPSGAAGEYDDLQASRRAVFHIVRQYEEWESPPKYQLDLRLPWNGESYKAIQPRMPNPDEAMDMPELTRERPEKGEDDLGDVNFDPDEVEEDTEEAPPPEDPAEEAPVETEEDAP